MIVCIWACGPRCIQPDKNININIRSRLAQKKKHTLLSVLSKRLRLLSSPDMTESGMEEKRTDGVGFIIVGVVVASGRCGAIPLFVLRFGGVVSAAMRVGDIIGAKCQCKLVSWIGIRVRGGATMSA
jgi:hypothetical protein